MCLLLLTLPPATQSQLSLNPWHFKSPCPFGLCFLFLPTLFGNLDDDLRLCTWILRPVCSFPVATGVIRLGARHLSLELQYLFSNLLGLGLCLPDIHCLQGHSSWTLDLGFHWSAPAGSVTVSNS